MAEGVDDAADAPAVVVFHVDDNGGSGGDGFFEGGVGVVDGEDHADGAAVEGFGLEFLCSGDSSASQNSAPSTASLATMDPLPSSWRNCSVAPKAAL